MFVARLFLLLEKLPGVVLHNYSVRRSHDWLLPPTKFLQPLILQKVEHLFAEVLPESGGFRALLSEVLAGLRSPPGTRVVKSCVQEQGMIGL